MLLCGSITSIHMSTDATLCGYMPSASHKVPPGTMTWSTTRNAQNTNSAAVLKLHKFLCATMVSYTWLNVTSFLCGVSTRLLTDRPAFAVQPPVCVQIRDPTSGNSLHFDKPYQNMSKSMCARPRRLMVGWCLMWCGENGMVRCGMNTKREPGKVEWTRASCGIMDKDRSLVARVKNDCGSARHTTTTVKCKRQIKKRKCA